MNQLNEMNEMNEIKKMNPRNKIMKQWMNETNKAKWNVMEWNG